MSITTAVKEVISDVKLFFNSRLRRKKDILIVLKGGKNFLDGKIDDGIISGVSVINQPASMALQGLDKALLVIIPELINILEIQIISLSDLSSADMIDKICKKISVLNSITITDRIENIVKKSLADKNLSFKEVVRLLTLKNK